LQVCADGGDAGELVEGCRDVFNAGLAAERDGERRLEWWNRHAYGIGWSNGVAYIRSLHSHHHLFDDLEKHLVFEKSEERISKP